MAKRPGKRAGKAVPPKRALKTSYPRFYKEGKRWRVIPSGSTRSRYWKGKPPGNSYRDRAGVLRNVKTGRPLPRPKLPPKPKGEVEAVRRLKKHLSTATGLSWRSESRGQEGYWRSRYRFTVHESERGEGAPFGDIAYASDLANADGKHIAALGNRAARIAVVARPEEGSRRDSREFSITSVEFYTHALERAETRLKYLEEHYEESPWVITEFLLWLK
jgi:hypothetical protein